MQTPCLPKLLVKSKKMLVYPGARLANLNLHVFVGQVPTAQNIRDNWEYKNAFYDYISVKLYRAAYLFILRGGSSSIDLYISHDKH